MSIRNAAKALIINDNKVLLNKCLNSTGCHLDGIQVEGVYYDLPGGGQNKYETLEETITRECREETGHNVVADKLVAIYEEIYTDDELNKLYPEYVHKVYFIFLCHLKNHQIEEATEIDRDQVECVWVNIEDLQKINLYPPIVKANIKGILSTQTAIFLGSKRI